MVCLPKESLFEKLNFLQNKSSDAKISMKTVLFRMDIATMAFVMLMISKLNIWLHEGVSFPVGKSVVQQFA